MAERRARNWRWGLLTLLFLGVALASVLTSNAQGKYTALTATPCSPRPAS